MSKPKRDHKPPAPFDYFESQPEGFEIFSWCPAPQPTVPPTQVHLHMPIAGAKLQGARLARPADRGAAGAP